MLVGAEVGAINREALSLVQRTQHTRPGEQLRLFPGLATFSCQGSVSSLLFIAENGTSQNSTLTFSLWKPGETSGRILMATIEDTREVKASELELVSKSLSQGDLALYRATLSPPLDFNTGDVFGVYHSAGAPALQYAYGLGPENYLGSAMSDESVQTLFTVSPVASNDLPLLALESYNCGNCKF